MKITDKQTLIELLQTSISVSNKKPKLLSSPERVAEIREEITCDISNYPWRESMAEIWSEVSEVQSSHYFNSLPSRETEAEQNPVLSLISAMDMPRIPSPEVLLAISEAFQIYMLAGGKLELEDVFFGSAKKGVGNYSARIRKEKSYSDFDFFVKNGDLFVNLSEREEFSQRSVESKAEEYLLYGFNPFRAKQFGHKPNFDNNIEVDSYLRGYRRWKRTTKA